MYAIKINNREKEEGSRKSRTLRESKSGGRVRKDWMAERAWSMRSSLMSATTLHRRASSSAGATARTANNQRNIDNAKNISFKRKRKKKKKKKMKGVNWRKGKGGTDSDLRLWWRCHMRRPGCGGWGLWRDLRGEEEAETPPTRVSASEPFWKTTTLRTAIRLFYDICVVSADQLRCLQGSVRVVDQYLGRIGSGFSFSRKVGYITN